MRTVLRLLLQNKKANIHSTPAARAIDETVMPAIAPLDTVPFAWSIETIGVATVPVNAVFIAPATTDDDDDADDNTDDDTDEEVEVVIPLVELVTGGNGIDNGVVVALILPVVVANPVVPSPAALPAATRNACRAFASGLNSIPLRSAAGQPAFVAQALVVQHPTNAGCWSSKVHV